MLVMYRSIVHGILVEKTFNLNISHVLCTITRHLFADVLCGHYYSNITFSLCILMNILLCTLIGKNSDLFLVGSMLRMIYYISDRHLLCLHYYVEFMCVTFRC
jgi:hypothetical protein